MRKLVTVTGSTLIVTVLISLVAVQALVIPAVWSRTTQVATGQPVADLVLSIVCVLALEAALALLLLLVRRRGRGEADPARDSRVRTGVEWCLFIAAALLITLMLFSLDGEGGSFLVIPLMVAVHTVTAVSCLVSTMVMASTSPDPLTPVDSILTGPVSNPVSWRNRLLVVLSQILTIVMLVVLLATQRLCLEGFSSAAIDRAASKLINRQFSPGWSPRLLPIWSIVCILLLEVALVIVLGVNHRRTRTDADPAWVTRMATVVRWDLLAAVFMALGFFITESMTVSYEMYMASIVIALSVGLVAVAGCLAAAAGTTYAALAPPRQHPAGGSEGN